MGMDNTPPRNRLIAFYALLATLALASLKPAFDSYYDRMHQRATGIALHEGADIQELGEVRAEWQRGLSGGRAPIAAVVQRMGAEGRAAFPEVAPVPST